MKVYAFLNAAKTEGWGAWNGQAVAKLALAWHFLLTDQQKKEVADFFDCPAAHWDLVSPACLAFLDQKCREGIWKWGPDD